MKDRFNFTTQYYFPGRFIWAFTTALAAVTFFAAGYYVLSVMIVIGGIGTATTRYGVEIDFASGYYKEYFWLFGLRLGNRIRFGKILYLFIKNFTIRQTFNSRLNSATFTHDEFRGYVKFSEQEKVHIISRNDYDELVKELKELADRFGVGLVDYSFGHRVELK